MAVTTREALASAPAPQPAPDPRWLRILRSPRTYLWLIAFAAVFPQAWHQLHVQGDTFMVDLTVYRQAGVSILHHRAIYSWYVRSEFSLLPFTYPPLAAVLAVPLALVPLHVDAVLWDLAVYGCLFWSSRLLLRPVITRMRVAGNRFEYVLLPAVWVYTAYMLPGIQQIHLGQVGIFLMCLVLFDLMTNRTGRLRGALVGLASGIKLTPLVFIPAFVVARRWREAAVGAAAFVVTAGLVWVVAPQSSHQFWTDSVQQPDRLGSNTDPANQSLRGALLRTALHGRTGDAVWIVLCVVVLAAGLYATTRAHRDGDELLFIVVGGLLSCLLSPVAWIHHYVWVYALMAWLLRERHHVLAAGMSLLWLFNWTGSYRNHVGTGGVAGAWWWLVGDLFAVSSLVIVLAFAVRAWSLRRDGHPTGAAESRSPVDASP
ncbi:MAG TPA: glycosyltransferase 87 family protein [Mycobacteriales bacterium]